ncbi:NAD-dependent protein deacetylase sirtuin-1 isoform X2 [Ambystoma mexicanum]|uniref:NAD-dependent protein deacetylase sirtuin-1 isoform X2 n=1 Tax=Ambystoma mexicanum TaxID=8296 RepID=UPI0037E86E81
MADKECGLSLQSNHMRDIDTNEEPVLKRRRTSRSPGSWGGGSPEVFRCGRLEIGQATEKEARGTEICHSTTIGAPAEDVRALNIERNTHLTDDSDEDDHASHASSSDWTPRPRIGPYTFVQHHLLLGTDPRTILNDLLPETIPPAELDDMTLWQVVINLLSEPPKRKKRKDINTIEDAVKLLKECTKIIVLTGAGVSVSCGIPDFRSRDGIYARLAVDFPDLSDPQAMFDIDYFKKDPRPFFKFAKEIYPGAFQPSLCHKFIAMLDKDGRLLRNYTQNIDTLEQVAGIQRIIQCHGSFATASCLICRYTVDCEAVREDIFNQVVPRCPKCPPEEPLAIMKPDIVFFGENLPEQFHRAMKYDKDEVDLLIVIGSSLKVRPVALIPSSIPQEVPQILINREPLNHLHFDVELLGDCDVIINELCQRLGNNYITLCYNLVKLSEIKEKPPQAPMAIEMQFSDVPVTPVDMNLPDKCALPGPSLAVKSSNLDFFSKSCYVEETVQELRVHIGTNTYVDNEPLVNIECIKESISNEEDKIADERKSEGETEKIIWNSTCTKEPTSKRLDRMQYIYITPSRYIFHGAEVYSDSDDVVSSSCGSSSESESYPSPEEGTEEDSDNEACFSGMENETSVSCEAIEFGMEENVIEKTDQTRN